MIEFTWPWLIALAPLPWIIKILCKPVAPSQEQALHLPFFDALNTPQFSTKSQSKVNRWTAFSALFAWVLFVLACTRPQWVDEPIALPLTGRDLMLAVDVSGSMETRDFVLNKKTVTRLSIVKYAANAFIQKRKGDRLGLILFGSNAYLQTPLTFDRKTVRQLLNEAVIGIAGKETAIGDAIGLALKRLRAGEVQDRILILMTDGANTAGEVEPLQAAELAAAENLRIYTIGLGADEMILQGGFFGQQTINPSRDLDEKSLKRIAELTGGQYFRAKNTDALSNIYAELDLLEPQSSDESFFRPTQSLYHWPLALALLFSVLATLLYFQVFNSRLNNDRVEHHD